MIYRCSWSVFYSSTHSLSSFSVALSPISLPPSSLSSLPPPSLPYPLFPPPSSLLPGPEKAPRRRVISPSSAQKPGSGPNCLPRQPAPQTWPSATCDHPGDRRQCPHTPLMHLTDCRQRYSSVVCRKCLFWYRIESINGTSFAAVVHVEHYPLFLFLISIIGFRNSKLF